MIPPEQLAILVEGDLAGGALDAAFNRLITYVEEGQYDLESIGRAFGSRVLDGLCLRLGETLRCTPPARFDAGLAAYVATEFVFPGGHTFVTRDLIRAQPGRRHLILLSGMLGGVDLAETRRFFGPEVEVEVSPSPLPAATAQWLVDRLAAAAPGRVFLLAHPQDAAAVAAFRPGLAGEMLFYHHLDHRLMLGVHLPHARHVDFRYAGFAGCRHGMGIGENLYLPLTAGEAVASPPPSFPLTTASAGRWGKFSLAYSFRYADQVPRWIATTGGRHVHIGHIPAEARAEIEAGLAYAAIPKSRFVNLPEVESLREALLRESVGVYIDSFPMGGCRTMVEAMSAGIPVIAHHHPVSMLLSNETVAHPGAFAWAEPGQLVGHLGALSPEALAAERVLVVEHYRREHDPGLLAEALAGEAVRGLPVPERAYAVSTLEQYLRGRESSTEPGFEEKVGRLVTEALGVASAKTREEKAQVSAALYQMSTQDPAGWLDRSATARRNLLLALTGREDLAAADGRLDYAEVSKHLFRRARRFAAAALEPEGPARSEWVVAGWPAPGGARRVELPEQPKEDEGAGAAPERLAQLEQAEHDLRWLLRRLGSGPQGRLLRRFPGFKALESRYLGGGGR